MAKKKAVGKKHPAKKLAVGKKKATKKASRKGVARERGANGTRKEPANAMAKRIGDRIYGLRFGKGMTLEKLAERMKSSVSYMSELENGLRPRISVDKLLGLAGIFKVTLDYFVCSPKDFKDKYEATASAPEAAETEAAPVV